MNWGLKITLLYLGFVGMILTFVVKASMQDFHLVTENYYEAELQYEDQIQKIKLTSELSAEIDIQYDANADKIMFKYPPQFEEISGNILLYRPSNSNLDQTIEIHADEAGMQEISSEEMMAGMWRIKINWQGGSNDFYQEKMVVVQ